jgi:hypothetical protein
LVGYKKMQLGRFKAKKAVNNSFFCFTNVI